MEKRDWRGEACVRAREADGELEQLMRSILKMFADGCLVYRTRERLERPVETKSDRLRRVRRQGGQVLVDGSAAVA